MSIQPFQGSQQIIIERRFADGTLDLRGEPQPPSHRCVHCGHESSVMSFDQLYAMFFLATKDAPDRGTSASYEELDAWLKSKGWSIRAKTW